MKCNFSNIYIKCIAIVQPEKKVLLHIVLAERKWQFQIHKFSHFFSRSNNGKPSYFLLTFTLRISLTVMKNNFKAIL
jgi:hypothetical protein